MILCAAEESAATIAVARSPERGGGKVCKVLLGRLPGKWLGTAKYPCSSQTHMRCKECSAYLGKDVFLCNGFVKGAPVNCHRHYHMYHHNKQFTSAMVIN